MKRIYFGTLILFFGLSSCSNDDNASNISESTFFPLASTSSWEYDVDLDKENIGHDVLFVSGETTINGKKYQQIKSSDLPTGFYTTILNTNNLRKEGDKLLLTGTTGLGANDFLTLDISVNDFIIFKENSDSNTQLSVISGSIEESLQEIPVKIDYQLTSVFQESLSNFSVPGKQSYSNVKVIKLIANLKVSTVYIVPVINTPLTITILEPQDVVISTQYYAEGIGMIYAKTQINYNVSDFSQFGLELPIPQTNSSTIEEFLE